MSGQKKDGGDLVFNENFDKEPEAAVTPPPPPPPPVAPPMTSTPSPPPSSAQASSSIPIPDVEEETVVPAVTPVKGGKESSSRVEPGEDVVLDFTESTAAPVTTGTIQPTDEMATAPPTDETNDQQPRRFGFLSLRWFHQFFNVDDKDVVKRLLSSMKGPFKRNFIEESRENPDLYGPFWIATTLIFITVVSSNAGSYTDHRQSDKKDEDWDGDYSMIGKAALLYYIYLFGFGVLFYLMLRAYGSQMTLSHVWCVYGYGLASFLPVMTIVVFLQLIHGDQLSDSLTYLTVAIGTLLSGAFLLMNFHEELKVFGAQSRVALIGLFCVHVVIGCLLAFYFH